MCGRIAGHCSMYAFALAIAAWMACSSGGSAGEGGGAEQGGGVKLKPLMPAVFWAVVFSLSGSLEG